MMHRFKSVLVFLVFLVLLAPCIAYANEALDGPETWHEQRFRNMIMQQYDMSCGAATIATILNRYAHKPVNEQFVIKALTSIVKPENVERVLELGFSLLDIKTVVKQLDLDMKAAKVSTDQLVAFSSPAMLQLKTDFGFHFVVWHGKINGYHWVGDPSRGDMWLSQKEFEREWTGIASWVFNSGKPLSQLSEMALQEKFHSR